MLNINSVYPYVAGIIDGEGSILLYKSCKGPYNWRYPVISVSSTCIRILNYLKDNLGGCICKHTTKEPHKQAYSWRLTNDRALCLLKDILPYMLEDTKVYRAKLLLSTYKEVTPRNGKYTEHLLSLKTKFETEFYDVVEK